MLYTSYPILFIACPRNVLAVQKDFSIWVDTRGLYRDIGQIIKSTQLKYRGDGYSKKVGQPMLNSKGTAQDSINSKGLLVVCLCQEKNPSNPSERHSMASKATCLVPVAKGKPVLPRKQNHRTPTSQPPATDDSNQQSKVALFIKYLTSITDSVVAADNRLKPTPFQKARPRLSNCPSMPTILQKHLHHPSPAASEAISAALTPAKGI